MRRARRTAFDAVKSVGGLLPLEYLERIAAGDSGIEGLTPQDYHLWDHEKLPEGANRAWSRLLGAWRAFQDGLDKLPEKDFAVRLTRERWLLPLFQELGYGRLQPWREAEVDGKPFALSHVWERAPIHLLGCRVPLDRRSKGVAGAAKASPHGLLQEFLNRSDEHLWGFVSDGYVLRLLRDHRSLTRQAYVEFDLRSIFDGESFSEFLLLWLVGHQSRVEGEKPEACWLEKWFQQSRQEGVRALDHLRRGVEEAITALGRGFLRRRENTRLHDALESGELDKQDYYRELLRLVYRLIFLFVAEDRGLLLDPKAPREAEERYRKFYSTARLRELSQRRRSGDWVDMWRALRLVMRQLDEGCPELALPALDSFLWRDEAVSWLIDAELANEDLLVAVYRLGHVEERGVVLPVSWQAIGSEELGSVYEALLELHPKIHREAPVFELETAAGHERKTTGSYYTPSELVDCLLDTALDPVLDEAAKNDDPERAILELKVCDPACGSGHFLVAAARRMAMRLASVRSGDEEPSPEMVQTALRDVVGGCIYGVDLNPMAVELCKVSLWMEALEPGKPLSFLDHHIQVGNSLLGATPALLAKGIPDEAFNPIEGDDKAFCRELKKRNKKERESRQMGLFDLKGEVWDRLGDLTSQLLRLEKIDDGTLEGVRRKEQRYYEIVESTGYEFGRFWADLWCAAFVWEKVEREDRPYPITEDLFRRVEATPHSGSSVKVVVRRFAEAYQFFHWHLAFPDVFQVNANEETSDDDVTGWNGGFDVILGNPPWDRLKLQEKEFFSVHDPRIACAPKAAARRRMIAELALDNPLLHEAFLRARRLAEGQSHLVRNTGRYPLCGRGDVNTYSVFAELNRSLLSPLGRVGCIVPSGIATDDTTKFFFQDVMDRGELYSLYDFQSGPGLFAEVGHARFKFCLLTMLGVASHSVDSAEFAFFLRDVQHLKEDGRRFKLSLNDIRIINPNTRTCPVFRSRRDAGITKAIYGQTPVLIKKGPPEENPWGAKFIAMFHMTNDSEFFRTKAQLQSDSWTLNGNRYFKRKDVYLPLYEAKMLHHFTHRYGDYDDRLEESESTALPEVPSERLEDPVYEPQPRYWIPKAKLEEVLNGRWERGWLAGWRDICRSTDERTVIAGVIPRIGVGNSMPLFLFKPYAGTLTACFVACLSSYVLDFAARFKVGGTHLNYFVIQQLPILPPATFTEQAAWYPQESYASWQKGRVLELTYTAWDLQPFAQDCGYDGPPFRWDEARRFLLRCELDAAFFHLYRIERNDVDYIMETFPIVKRKDEKAHGEYRTKRVILEIYDEMQRAIDTGEPYATRLDPPPADPRVAHPPREGEPAVVVPFPADEVSEPYPERRPQLQKVAEPRVSSSPPDAPAVRAENPADAVVGWLESNPGWHARFDVVDALGLTASEWNKAIGELVESGVVERTGEKRGTRYRFRGADDRLIVAWLAENPGWHARGDVLDALELDPADWTREIGELVASGEIVKTGEKRGTRYRYPGGDAELVVSWLADNPGWHSRGEVLLALELDVADWNRVIGDLVDAGEVEKTGQRRGTRYRV